MRQSLLLLIAASLIAAISCQNQNKTADYILLSGKVTEANSDSLGVYNMQQKHLKTIRLNEDKSFSDTLRLADGLYFLYDGSNAMRVYLQKGFNLSLQINANNMEQSKFTGKGASENDFIKESDELNAQLEKQKHYSYYCRLPEADFLSLNDSIYQLSSDLLAKSEAKLDPEFVFLEQENLKYDRLNRISNYKEYNTYYLNEGKPFEVSENYPNPFEKIDLNNKKLTKVDAYMELLGKYINMPEHTDTSEGDPMLKRLQRIEQLISNKVIKEKLAQSWYEEILDQTKDLEASYQMLKTMISDKESSKKIEKAYSELKKLVKGQVSPSFNLKDINGKSISLESLKGSLVYIDVWATWCGPCRGEIPSLQKLEKEMEGKNIKFLSMCVWDKKENWEKMLAEEHLGGIQVFASRDELSFVNAYRIKGIPRFIIIDQEGKIVDSNAKRPSNPKLKAELESLL